MCGYAGPPWQVALNRGMLGFYRPELFLFREVRCSGAECNENTLNNFGRPVALTEPGHFSAFELSFCNVRRDPADLASDSPR